MKFIPQKSGIWIKEIMRNTGWAQRIGPIQERLYEKNNSRRRGGEPPRETCIFVSKDGGAKMGAPAATEGSRQGRSRAHFGGGEKER